MRTILAFAFVFGLVGIAHADGKTADKKPAAGTIVAAKVPPMPPQLNDTLFSDAGDAKWSPIDGLPKGAMGALIGTDPANGGMAGWLKLPAGYKVPLGWETHMHSYTVVSGQLTITDNNKKHVLGVGGFTMLTGHDKYEMSCGAAECLLVVNHLGPPDQHWAPAKAK
jgi:hypothetical protein